MQIDRSRVGLEDHFAAWQRARVLSFASKAAIARYHIRRNRYEPSEYVFSGDFPATQQPLYLDTCFASIVLMTAIDQVFPRVFRFPPLFNPRCSIAADLPRYTEIDAASRNRLKCIRRMRESNLLSCMRARRLVLSILFVIYEAKHESEIE